ncbi:hypothetical protein DPMN_116424 [Dreissena polymorpha]|uniref:Uncharacterized protein n=1 Tax=Dreissena polymorpha TaxID=45954 RepID=A0A9D4KNP0_DREPO|nr:hypothetical protein DPMN_116424 [Dreissena polymorpha]
MKGSAISKDIFSEHKRHWPLGKALRIVGNSRYGDWEKSGAKIGKPPVGFGKGTVPRY